MLWPLLGGAPHNFLEEAAAEVAWSPDGTRLVYHTWQAGDPTFVADHNGANQSLIVHNEPGLHNHYPVCRMMDAGSTLCAVGQPRERWTFGVFHRIGENRNNSHISSHADIEVMHRTEKGDHRWKLNHYEKENLRRKKLKA
jgi:hypothetical protein